MQNQRKKPQQIESEKIASLPNKLYFSIGEVARVCELKTHVLRYWEREFPQLTAIRHRGNRRCYRRQDISLILQIKNLLYDQGFTIQGARAQLSSALTQTPEWRLNIVHELENVLAELEL